MIGGSEVRSTYNNLNKNIDAYNNAIKGLSGTWKGVSHDSLTPKATNTIEKYMETLKGSFEQFAVACDKYEEYKKKKEDLTDVNKKITKYSNILKEGKGGFSTDIILSNFRNKKAILEKEINRLKKEIKEALSSVKSVVVKQSSSTSGIPGIINKMVKQFEQSVEDEQKKKQLIDSLYADIGNTINDYPGMGFANGNWCANFVSYQLNKNGYTVEPSALAGDGYVYGKKTIMQVMRDQGAQIHLDEGSKYYSDINSSEYDPNYSPQPGDVFCIDFDHNGSSNHTGFVVKDNGDGTITTIEGNTSGRAGSSCVEEKVRDRSEIYGYATPVKKLDNKEDKDEDE